MSKVIWKVIVFPNNYSVDVPIGAELLYAREQRQDICIWFRCDSDAPRHSYPIAVIGTGCGCPKTGRYIGSAHLPEGLVYHIFDMGRAA